MLMENDFHLNHTQIMSKTLIVLVVASAEDRLKPLSEPGLIITLIPGGGIPRADYKEVRIISAQRYLNGFASILRSWFHFSGEGPQPMVYISPGSEMSMTAALQEAATHRHDVWIVHPEWQHTVYGRYHGPEYQAVKQELEMQEVAQPLYDDGGIPRFPEKATAAEYLQACLRNYRESLGSTNRERQISQLVRLVMKWATTAR